MRAGWLALCLALAWQPATASAPPAHVTCGSVIKLAHVNTDCRLHSHDVGYGYGQGGSGQQSVTCYPELDSSQSYWIVKCAPDVAQGQPIHSGDQIRLQHGTSGRWLHSHEFKSPLSNNQEVSCFGSNTESDAGDDWLVEWETKKQGKTWQQDVPVWLKHKQTGYYMASNNQVYNRPIAGHKEVYAAKAKNAPAKWKAAEGIYIPVVAQESS